MTMNYMDYTDDACMYMFTGGQKTRMRAVTDGGFRNSLATSPGCIPPSGGGSCGVPIGLAASNIQQTTATCSWGSVSGATSYTFEIKLSTATTWTVQNLTGTSVNLSNLTSGATYNTRVKANCSGGSGNYTTTVNFTTLGASCTDVYETNNARNQAKNLTLGTTLTAKIATTTDQDWFKFKNTNTQKNIRVFLSNLPADYDLELYRGTIRVGLSENYDLQNELVIYNNNLTATTYYARVYGFDGASSPNCYSLLAQISSTSFTSRLSEDEVQPEDVLEPVMDEMLIFPNPASTTVQLVLPFGKAGSGKLSISDVTGRYVLVQNLESKDHQQTMDLDVSSLSSGMYMVRFESGDKVFTSRMLVSASY